MPTNPAAFALPHTKLAIGGFPLAMARPERITDNATVEFLDTGHFALETHVDQIAAAM